MSERLLVEELWHTLQYPHRSREKTLDLHTVSRQMSAKWRPSWPINKFMCTGIAVFPIKFPCETNIKSLLLKSQLASYSSLAGSRDQPYYSLDWGLSLRYFLIFKWKPTTDLFSPLALKKDQNLTWRLLECCKNIVMKSRADSNVIISLLSSVGDQLSYILRANIHINGQTVLFIRAPSLHYITVNTRPSSVSKATQQAMFQRGL